MKPLARKRLTFQSFLKLILPLSKNMVPIQFNISFVRKYSSRKYLEFLVEKQMINQYSLTFCFYLFIFFNKGYRN